MMPRVRRAFGPVRRLERADPVRDRLQPGQRRTTVGERLEQIEDRQPGQDRRGPCRGSASGARRRPPGDAVLGQVAEDLPDRPDDDHRGHRDEEEVGRERERLAGLPDAAQVAVGQQHDTPPGTSRPCTGSSDVHGGGDRGDRGGRLHRDRHDVVDQQRDRGDLGHLVAEVLPAHDVRAAGPGVDHHHLAVGQRHQHQDDQDHRGHRGQDVEAGQAEHTEQDDQHLLGAVGRGRDAVAGQHAERQPLGQLLLVQLGADQRRPEQHPLDPVAEPFGYRDGGGQRRRGGLLGARGRTCVMAMRLRLSGHSGARS